VGSRGGPSEMRRERMGLGSDMAHVRERERQQRRVSEQGRRGAQGGSKGLTQCMRGRGQQGGRFKAAVWQGRGRGGVRGRSEWPTWHARGRDRRGGGETRRERERRGLGSDMVRMRERRGATAAASWQPRERGDPKSKGPIQCARGRGGGSEVARRRERLCERGLSGQEGLVNGGMASGAERRGQAAEGEA